MSRGVLAIDFETANRSPDSACAIAAVLIKDGAVTDRHMSLMRPYADGFCFSYLHGITAADVKDKPHFDVIWTTELRPLWEQADLLIAHNIAFDLNVLFACSRRAKIVPSPKGYLCTVQLSRRVSPEMPDHKLNTVCSSLGIALHHHDALSDAMGCAAIYQRAVQMKADVSPRLRDGWTVQGLPPTPSEHAHKPRDHRARRIQTVDPVEVERIKAWAIGEARRKLEAKAMARQVPKKHGWLWRWLFGESRV
jgi:DNA polymerase-3 subunit epsilon